MSDRIVVMKDGEVQQIGTPQEVFNDPVNTFVAGFIGTPQMNMFKGSLLADGNGGYKVRVGEAEMPLSEEKCRNLAARNVASQDVIVGVRPEHISLDSTPGASVSGKVDVSEMMGSSVHLHINVDGSDCIIIVPTLDLEDGSHGIGTDLEFTFAPNAIHLFDPETGMNLEHV